MKKLFFVLSIIIATTLASFAQGLKLPALSPTCKISQDFSTSNIEIAYSRPSMRGRVIFGDLVPYGSVWRTGANSATKVKFGEDVLVNGVSLKAGEYALYTIPGKESWTVILNKGTGNWGAMGYEASDDVARFILKPKALSKDMQTFTINVTDISLSTCNIELAWEKTKIVIPVKANNEERLNADIDKAINKPNIPYFQAANYYYETNQNLDKAYDYVNKALVDNQKAYYMWNLKARIAQKLGKKDEAITAAKQSIETAKGTAFEEEYAHKGKAIINSYAKN
jgi:tetratricopeptide (TPR) repeat protein